jgi:hypothetical protein
MLDAKDFAESLRIIHKSEGGHVHNSDPVRGFLWWGIKFIAWVSLALLVGAVTIVAMFYPPVFIVVILIVFIMSHFMWMGKKN